MKTKKNYQKLLSFVLALAMIVSVFTVAGPTEVQAAEKSFKGKGTSVVKFSDMDCVDTTTMDWATQWIKFKPSVTGYVTLTFSSISQQFADTYGTIQICNNKKKAIGMVENWQNAIGSSKAATSRTYGVEKGKTYYFKVVCEGGTSIKAKVTKVTKSKANSKAKAKNLTKGKAVKGVIPANSSKADWYKIKLTKSAKLRLIYTAQTNGVMASGNYLAAAGGIKFTFYDKDGKVWGSAISNLTPYSPEGGWDISLVSSRTGSEHDIPTGTYWIKVERINKNSCGMYTVKWTTY